MLNGIPSPAILKQFFFFILHVLGENSSFGLVHKQRTNTLNYNALLYIVSYFHKFDSH